MSTRPNAEAEWEARIARIEAAEAAPESWAGSVTTDKPDVTETEKRNP